MSLLKFLILLILSYKSITKVSALLKFTNVHCESFNKSISEFQYCRLKAIKRNVTVFNMKMFIKIPADVIFVQVQMFQKANGYKPFPINYTIDCCDFVKKHNHPFLNLVYDKFKNFSSINHTCPYQGTQIIDGFYYKNQSPLKLPWPTGNYLLTLNWYVRKIKAFCTNVYFMVY